jgi:DNA-binding MurR/RpiR family transcriptional regulator
VVNRKNFAMQHPMPFEKRRESGLQSMSPAEQRVSRYFQDNREEVLFASASVLAKKTGTSDATVVRTAKALGFSGMDELRRTLAAELRENLTPAARLAGTLDEVGDDLQAAFNVTLNIHQKAIEDLRRDVSPEQFEMAVQLISNARRLVIFGIGPSSAMATYFEIQLGRLAARHSVSRKPACCSPMVCRS